MSLKRLRRDLAAVSAAKKTSVQTWSEMIGPLHAKCEVASKFGERLIFTRVGAEALGKLLKTMAEKLDSISS